MPRVARNECRAWPYAIEAHHPMSAPWIVRLPVPIQNLIHGSIPRRNDQLYLDHWIIPFDETRFNEEIWQR